VDVARSRRPATARRRGAEARAALARRQGAAIAVGHPTVPELFGDGVYEGGAVVLHALRGEVGDEVFFSIVRTWVERHGGGAATTDEFRALAAELAGRDLDGFFDAWLDVGDPPDAYPG
jgi:aminopeptidase N